MYESLINRIGKLPLDTSIYCGHEYTSKNFDFALSIEPSNNAIKAAQEKWTQHKAIVPSLLSEEWKYNPFMRVEDLSVQQKMNTVGDAIATMRSLREAKDRF
jgi:hydroxyacylglutathione hydrolase